MSDLRARLNEHQVILLCLFLPLRRCNLPLIIQIRLVAHKHDNDVVSSLAPDIVDPFPGVLEGLGVGDIVDDNGDAGVADVGGDETAEAFLASCVPELESHGAVLEVHSLRIVSA